LITNAIKFTQEGKVIVNCTGTPRFKPTCLEIQVEDNGIGIPKEKFSSLFKEFSKIEDS
jgi:two-component system, sensor histidine kinase